MCYCAYFGCNATLPIDFCGSLLDFGSGITVAPNSQVSLRLCYYRLHYPVWRGRQWHNFCDSATQIGPRPPRFEVSRLPTIRHTHIHTVGLLWTSDQLVAEAATYTTHNEYPRIQRDWPPDPSNQAATDCVLHFTASGAGPMVQYTYYFVKFLM
jgi:hypothetical protein